MKRKKKINIETLFLVSLICLTFIKILTVEKNNDKFPEKSEKELLILVNNENKIPDNYKPILIKYKGFKLENSIIKSLKQMEKDACGDKTCLYMNNSYRTSSEQQKEFNNKVNEYMKKGLTRDEATETSKKEVQQAGYSEHQTGLAIDFSMRNNDYNWKMWYWLQDNAYKYGFILRYPKDKTQITKIDYEPWHYRYTGEKAAKIMYDENLCLEEYIEKYKKKEG